MKSPISSGAITPFQGARSSVATVQITITNRPVAIISSTSAPPLEMPSPGAVSRESTARSEYTAATARTAKNPPTSCASQYGPTSFGGNFRATASPRDTAGLKWPPETCPSAVIASARPRPNAKAIPRLLIAPPPMSTETAIALKPRKKKRNVPSASAARRRPSDDDSTHPPPFDESVGLRRSGEAPSRKVSTAPPRPAAGAPGSAEHFSTRLRRAPGPFGWPTSEFSLFFRVKPGESAGLRAARRDLQETSGVPAWRAECARRRRRIASASGQLVWPGRLQRRSGVPGKDPLEL